MPTDFNDANIVCPFYLYSAKKSISCEGVTDGSRLKMLFDTHKDMHYYRCNYCSAKYKNCKIYSMLEKKYE
jgi:hypothetical protein